MWFDVEFERQTTILRTRLNLSKLWFDVEFERQTTFRQFKSKFIQLWFDVEFERQTTEGGGAFGRLYIVV